MQFREAARIASQMRQDFIDKTYAQLGGHQLRACETTYPMDTAPIKTHPTSCDCRPSIRDKAKVYAPVITCPVCGESFPINDSGYASTCDCVK